MRRLSKAADGERTSLAQVDTICVILEDLLLAELLLHLHRNQHLRHLALYRFLRSQEEGSRKLHGNRRATLLVTLVGQINPSCLRQTDKINPAVLKETSVFNCQHG